MEIDRRWRDAGVPLRHSKPPEGMNSADQWDKKRSQIAERIGTGFTIAIIGGRGTGKTQLGVEIIREAVKTQYNSAMYITAMEVFMAIRESYRKDGPTETSQIDKFARPKLLVLDEAHERSESDWENRLLTHLLDRRYRNMLDTLILSNHDHDGFRESMGQSIYSRLTETGGIMSADWPTFRKPGKR